MDISNLPAGPPPPGGQPNFDAPNPLYSIILATVVLASILTTFFTAARLFTKQLVSNYNVEDCNELGSPSLFLC